MKKENFNRLIKRGLIKKPPEIFIKNKPYQKNPNPSLKELQGIINISPLREIFLFTISEPYSTITDSFIKKGAGTIKPIDSESSTFLPKIPYISKTNIRILPELLEQYGVVLMKGGIILTCSKADIPNCDVLVSIVCFSLYVKFFVDLLKEERSVKISNRLSNFIKKTVSSEINKKTFYEMENSTSDKSIEATGKTMVNYGLVDSFFGNISSISDNLIFISESGSYLDDLYGKITKIPLTGTFDSALNPSSEYKIHREIYKETNFRFIIHGHPFFSVIMSIYCNSAECNEKRGAYGNNNPDRYIGDIPIIKGTSGTEHPELAIKVSEKIKEIGTVALYGHGIFCAAENNFSQALNNMISTELICLKKFLTVSGISS